MSEPNLLFLDHCTVHASFADIHKTGQPHPNASKHSHSIKTSSKTEGEGGMVMYKREDERLEIVHEKELDIFTEV